MPTDWVWGLCGGLMIGLAASIYLLVSGRIMGASGIIGGLVDRSVRGSAAIERMFFLAGLILVPLTILPFTTNDGTHLTGNWAVILIAGALVGLGTRLALGCTSGHGVCGLSRLSPRGIAASALYVGAGIVTVGVLRHVAGFI
jgi:uncharacterized protein